jgi:hypothetical protein
MTLHNAVSTHKLHYFGMLLPLALLLGCGTPAAKPPQGWTMPGSWTLTLTVSSDIYDATEVGNYMTVTTSIAAIDCSAFTDYFGVTLSSTPTDVCYNGTQMTVKSVVSGSVAGAFGQPQELALDLGTGSPEMQSGQAVPLRMVMTQTNTYAGFDEIAGLSGMAQDGTINGTWQIPGIDGTFSGSKQ